MSRFCSDNNNFPYDNNVLVLDMVLGSLWGAPQPINWDNVAKLVPGFTAKECARRFEELNNAGRFPHVDNQCNALTEGSTSPSSGLSTLLDTGDMVDTGSGQSTSKVTELFSGLSKALLEQSNILQAVQFFAKNVCQCPKNTELWY
ncbi:hypothetical protein F2P81_025666 [Scophthalmus maximus]|uniref:Uncharacterized protein n=1 Tax=Scophthalmus maximus TaxID=52904 RepID=A0A6A4RSU1_SCOMX|nr:hypothetical protein F2P81_025666 [Scophthalmus maximus]